MSIVCRHLRIWDQLIYNYFSAINTLECATSRQSSFYADCNFGPSCNPWFARQILTGLKLTHAFRHTHQIAVLRCQPTSM